jgi:hypothetical protein
MLAALSAFGFWRVAPTEQGLRTGMHLLDCSIQSVPVLVMASI